MQENIPRGSAMYTQEDPDLARGYRQLDLIEGEAPFLPWPAYTKIRKELGDQPGGIRYGDVRIDMQPAIRNIRDRFGMHGKSLAGFARGSHEIVRDSFLGVLPAQKSKNLTAILVSPYFPEVWRFLNSPIANRARIMSKNIEAPLVSLSPHFSPSQEAVKKAINEVKDIKKRAGDFMVYVSHTNSFTGETIPLPLIEELALEVKKIGDERKTVIDLGLKSMIFAPLKSRGQVIGVLTIGSSAKGFNYSEDDIPFIEELAGRAGTAVDKAMLYNEAQEAIRMRDEYLSITSHELKTPLTAILLNLQLALMKIHKAANQGTVPKEVVELIEANIAQSQRMSRLINDLLNISVVSSGRLQIEKERTDLSELIEGTLERLKNTLKRGKVKVIFTPKTGVIGNWDKLRIEQVITNLISNAIKYGEKKPITITVSKANDNAVLEVKDQGIGIAKEDQHFIFERFKRAVASKEFKGLGVGLYISQQIIEAHKGKLTVESTPKKGSTFTVTIPIGNI